MGGGGGGEVEFNSDMSIIYKSKEVLSYFMRKGFAALSSWARFSENDVAKQRKVQLKWNLGDGALICLTLPQKIKSPKLSLMASVAQVPGPIDGPQVRRQHGRRSSVWEVSVFPSAPAQVAWIQADNRYLQNVGMMQGEKVS